MTMPDTLFIRIADADSDSIDPGFAAPAHDPRDGAAPTYEPLDGAGQPLPATGIAGVLALVHADGHFGVALWSQVGKAGVEYIASCLNADGEICDPRTWNGHPTPEAALAMLATALRD